MDTCSEDYRALCEARYVVKLPNKLSRSAYIERVRKVRGDKSADELGKLVLELWSQGKR